MVIGWTRFGKGFIYLDEVDLSAGHCPADKVGLDKIRTKTCGWERRYEIIKEWTGLERYKERGE